MTALPSPPRPDAARAATAPGPSLVFPGPTGASTNPASFTSAAPLAAPGAATGAPLDPPLESSRDRVGAWLSTLDALLRLPDADRRSVRDELESHVRERVLDLMRAGRSEDRAIDESIAELGDAARLARKFRLAAGSPLRRRIMNLAIIGVAGAACVLGGVMAGGGRQPGADVRVFQPPAEQAEVAGAQVRLAAKLTLEQALRSLGEQTRRPVKIRLREIREELGWDTANQIGESIDPASFEEVVRLISIQVAGHPEGLAWRTQPDGTLLFSSRSDFDRREMTLATYNLDDVVTLRAGIKPEAPYAQVEEEVMTETVELITSFADPELWEKNGGDLGRVRTFGGILYVEAPRRLHSRVEWLIEELPRDPAALQHDPEDVHEATIILTGEWTPEQAKAYLGTWAGGSFAGVEPKPVIIANANKTLTVRASPAVVQMCRWIVAYVEGVLAARPDLTGNGARPAGSPELMR